jgi:iron complex transport system substrate-binding protein
MWPALRYGHSPWLEVPVVRSLLSIRFPRALRCAVMVPMLAGPAACRERAIAASSAVTDDFGDTLRLAAAPKRIVSLNPTTTELLFAIGAGPRVVGRTSYDIFPAEVRAVADLGPGLRPNVEAVLAVHPDLVLLYASADNRDAARRLRASGVPTAAYRIDRIADMERVTLVLGRLTADTLAAHRTVDSVRATLDRVRRATASLPHPSTFWPLWESPLLSVGGGSFLNELLEIAGGRNVFADLPQPSPTVSFEELLRRDPDVIIASAASTRHFAASDRFQTLRAIREHRIVVVDSTIATGPSARVGASAVSLARVLHPGVTF